MHKRKHTAMCFTTLHKQIEDIPAALQQYSKARLPDAHAVCKMSENGFGKNKLHQSLFKYISSCHQLIMLLLFGVVSTR
jgi:2-polyprenyl-6-methoxyphenol hydroxylase-like FAD-dependent oxidoreductase